MNLSSLQKYAALTGQTIVIEGDSHPVSYIKINGKTQAHVSSLYESGRVVVGDARSRHGVHCVRYDLCRSGRCFFEARRNWASGAEQKSWNRSYEFALHVAGVLGVKTSEL